MIARMQENDEYLIECGGPREIEMKTGRKPTRMMRHIAEVTHAEVGFMTLTVREERNAKVTTLPEVKNELLHISRDLLRIFTPHDSTPKASA